VGQRLLLRRVQPSSLDFEAKSEHRHPIAGRCLAAQSATLLIQRQMPSGKNRRLTGQPRALGLVQGFATAAALTSGPASSRNP
jgi:hypothetical protein